MVIGEGLTWCLPLLVGGAGSGRGAATQTQYDLGAREASGQLPRRGTPFEFVVRFNPRERVGPPKVCYDSEPAVI